MHQNTAYKKMYSQEQTFNEKEWLYDILFIKRYLTMFMNIENDRDK